MKKSRPPVWFTERATRDVDRCRLFLWRTPGGNPARRIPELLLEARRIARNPKLYPVESVHPISGLEFRRKSVGQFVIIYAYIEPTTADPRGLVSVRSIRHSAEEDVFFQVEESRPSGAARPFPRLFVGERPAPYPYHRNR